MCCCICSIHFFRYPTLFGIWKCVIVEKEPVGLELIQFLNLMVMSSLKLTVLICSPDFNTPWDSQILCISLKYYPLDKFRDSTVTENPCGLPLVTGPCRALILRWGFDEETGCCRTFIYGGCGGNNNNFMSQAQCMDTCGNCPQVRCSEPCEFGFKRSCKGCPTCDCIGEPTFILLLSHRF